MKDDQADKLVCVLERLTDEVHRCHLAITESNKIDGLVTKQDLNDAVHRIKDAIGVNQEDQQLLQASLGRLNHIVKRIKALDAKTQRT